MTGDNHVRICNACVLSTEVVVYLVMDHLTSAQSVGSISQGCTLCALYVYRVVVYLVMNRLRPITESLSVFSR